MLAFVLKIFGVAFFESSIILLQKTTKQFNQTKTLSLLPTPYFIKYYKSI